MRVLCIDTCRVRGMREQWCRTLHMKQDLEDWGLLALRTSCGGAPGPCGGATHCSSKCWLPQVLLALLGRQACNCPTRSVCHSF